MEYSGSTHIDKSLSKQIVRCDKTDISVINSNFILNNDFYVHLPKVVFQFSASTYICINKIWKLESKRNLSLLVYLCLPLNQVLLDIKQLDDYTLYKSLLYILRRVILSMFQGVIRSIMLNLTFETNYSFTNTKQGVVLL